MLQVPDNTIMGIFQFKSSKVYLRSVIKALPKNGRGEATRWARVLGVSTTLISQVLAGDKFLTPEQTHSLGSYLGLTGLEADYFTYLVLMERAGSDTLAKYWSAKLEDIRQGSLKLAARLKADRVLADHERALFYSTPLYSAVRLFTSVGAKGKSLGEICERFHLSRARAAEVLKFLCETGLIIEVNNRFMMGSQSTHLERGSPHLSRHHTHWRLKAIQQAEDMSERELMYTAPVSLSAEDFDRLREEMVEFIKTFLKTVHASPAEEIACFNMDFFWIR